MNKPIRVKKTTASGSNRAGRKSAQHLTLSRLEEILRVLPNHPKRISTADVAQRLQDEGFKVSKRTVERDLAKLAETRPIARIRHADGRNSWGWQQHAVKLDIDKELTGHQALAFTLIKRFLDRLLPVSTLEVLKPYFDTAEKKLQMLGKNPYSAGMPSWANKIRVVHPTQPLIPPKIDAGVQHAVYEALLRNRQLSIAYKKRGAEEPEEYAVNPLGLVQRGPVLYLVCTRTGTDAVRLRALHRILSALIMNEPSRPPAGFDLDRYIAAGNLDFASGSGTTITLEAAFDAFAAERLLESPLSEDQTVETLADQRVKIRATVLDTPQLFWWLLAFGENVEVLAPAPLRDRVATAAAAMYKLYSHG